VGDRFRFADEVPGLGEDLDHALLGGEGRGAGDSLVELRGLRIGDPLGSLADHPAVPADDRPGRQLQFAPPGDVGEITEGADHRDARTLLGIGEGVRDDGHFHIEAGVRTVEPNSGW